MLEQFSPMIIISMELLHVYTRNNRYFLKLLNYSQSENLKELYSCVKLTSKKQ
jgi:hypothetical protein